MEQAQQYYLRSKFMFMNNVINHHSSSSWEEKAFAEDHHGGIGGCIWPPRSYSCSFCKREFRSAQALGGHMNVHRKDRARLKDSSSSSSSSPPDHHYQTNDHVCVRPNDDRQNLTALSSPTSRVSVLPTTQNFSSHHYSVRQQKDSKPEVVKNSREEASAVCLSHHNNLFSSKRAKTEIFALSFLTKPCSNDRCGFQSEVPGIISSSLEDIDLELRLGQPPKNGRLTSKVSLVRLM